jgi:hypothetical protein
MLGGSGCGPRERQAVPPRLTGVSLSPSVRQGSEMDQPIQPKRVLSRPLMGGSRAQDLPRGQQRIETSGVANALGARMGFPVRPSGSSTDCGIIFVRDSLLTRVQRTLRLPAMRRMTI